MIDIKLLRSNSEIFYKSCQARGFDTKVLDNFFVLDDKWRSNLRDINGLKHEKTKLQLRYQKL